MQRLYFIASYPRSGNTWVRALLFELLRRQGVFPTEPGDLRPIDAYLPSDVTPIYYSRVTGKAAPEISPQLAAAARAQVHRLLAETSKTPLYVKTHAAYGMFSGQPTFNVSVTRGAVYLVRNPVDVARSLANFVGEEIGEIVRVMATDSAAQPSGPDTIWEPWSSWAINVRSWLGARDFPVLVVRYEDLRSDPVGWLGRIAGHAGIVATETELRAVVEDLTLDKMRAMAETGTLTVPKRGPVGSFVGSQLEAGSGIGEDTFAPLRTHAAAVMRDLGYR